MRFVRCLLLVALAACGPVADPSPQTVGQADAAFLQQMLVDQQAGAALASLALSPDRRVSAELQVIAQRIAASHDRQAAALSRWLRQWQIPCPAAATPDSDLARLRGARFERRWVRRMQAHLAAEIALGQSELRDPLLRDEAQTIVRIQDGQLRALRSYR